MVAESHNDVHPHSPITIKCSWTVEQPLNCSSLRYILENREYIFLSSSLYFIHLISYDFRFYFSALVADVFISGMFFISSIYIYYFHYNLYFIISNFFFIYYWEVPIIILFRILEFFHDFSLYGFYRIFLIYLLKKTIFV